MRIQVVDNCARVFTFVSPIPQVSMMIKVCVSGCQLKLAFGRKLVVEIFQSFPCKRRKTCRIATKKQLLVNL
jgi:hypothetical protein